MLRLLSLGCKTKKVSKINFNNEVFVMQSGERKVYLVAEDRWITINGTHLLVSDKGKILNDKMRKKIEGTSKENGGDSKVDKTTKTETASKEQEEKKKQTIKNYGGTDLTKSEVNKKYGGNLISMNSDGEYTFKSPDAVYDFMDDVENKTNGGNYAGTLSKEELGVLKALAWSKNSVVDPSDRMWIQDSFGRAIRAKLK